MQWYLTLVITCIDLLAEQLFMCLFMLLGEMSIFLAYFIIGLLIFLSWICNLFYSMFFFIGICLLYSPPAHSGIDMDIRVLFKNTVKLNPFWVDQFEHLIPSHSSRYLPTGGKHSFRKQNVALLVQGRLSYTQDSSGLSMKKSTGVLKSLLQQIWGLIGAR